MRTLLFLSLLVLLFSCGPESEVYRQLNGSDSLVIHFNEPATHLIARSVHTTDSKAIRQLIRFVDDKTIPARYCTFDGSLLFYEQEKLTGEVAFHFREDSCRQFVIRLNDRGELRSLKLGREAADFLQSLSEGKNWY